MNRSELGEILRAEGIRSDAYDLNGGRDKTEAYVLREEPFGWTVFYSERGLESGPQTFDSEAEACEYLLARLRRLYILQTR